MRWRHSRVLCCGSSNALHAGGSNKVLRYTRRSRVPCYGSSCKALNLGSSSRVLCFGGSSRVLRCGRSSRVPCYGSSSSRVLCYGSCCRVLYYGSGIGGDYLRFVIGDQNVVRRCSSLFVIVRRCSSSFFIPQKDARQHVGHQNYLGLKKFEAVPIFINVSATLAATSVCSTPSFGPLQSSYLEEQT